MDRRRRSRSTDRRRRRGPGKRAVGESELAKGRQWWAFQPVHELVASHDVKARTKLDHFVLAKLAEKGLTPSPEAGTPER